MRRIALRLSDLRYLYFVCSHICRRKIVANKRFLLCYGGNNISAPHTLRSTPTLHGCHTSWALGLRLWQTISCQLEPDEKNHFLFKLLGDGGYELYLGKIIA